jgi:hypothetical protein
MMAFPGPQHRPLQSRDIIDLCKSTPHFAGNEYGNQLVRISEDLVVKFGLGVRRQEADSQIYARRFVDNTKLYIPEVLLFFEAQFSGCKMGFLVMEYVNGISLEGINVQDRPDIAKRTIDAIQHLATIPVPEQGPGPVGIASPYGYLWSENGAGRTFSCVKDMDKWMNKRLEVVNQQPLSLAHHPLRMCHMDLVRRNILLLPNSSLCFVDWAFAGFFPSLFEIYNFRELLYTDKAWFQQLLDLWPKLDDYDEQTLQSLGIVASVNMRYS